MLYSVGRHVCSVLPPKSVPVKCVRCGWVLEPPRPAIACLSPTAAYAQQGSTCRKLNPPPVGTYPLACRYYRIRTDCGFGSVQALRHRPCNLPSTTKAGVCGSSGPLARDLGSFSSSLPSPTSPGYYYLVFSMILSPLALCRCSFLDHTISSHHQPIATPPYLT
jgi:hypothetical protein